MRMTGKTIVVAYTELFEWQFGSGTVTIYYLEYFKNVEL